MLDVDSVIERLLKALGDVQSDLDRYVSKMSKAKAEVEECAQLVGSARRFKLSHQFCFLTNIKIVQRGIRLSTTLRN